MSIIIKGMKMPKSCEECQVCDYEEGDCLLTGTYLIQGENTLPHNGERRDWCPLVEITDPKIMSAKMQLIKETTHDAEIAHVKADGLMCELLTELGYGEAVKIFDEMEKWYS